MEEDKDKCHCNDECCCDDNCSCGDECTCGDECCCEEEKGCDCMSHKHKEDKQKHKEKKKDKFEILQDKAAEYLLLAQRTQADFDNFRRHSQEKIIQANQDGKISTIEVFLPCLDTFNLAKKNINDEKTLAGVLMIEDKINQTLEQMGVSKISSIGEKYDANLHEVITVMTNEEKENDIILEEFQAGYKYNDKVIRYAKVIVNKKEEN